MHHYKDEIKKIKGKISSDLGVEDIDQLIKFVKENNISLGTQLADSLDIEEEEEEEEEGGEGNTASGNNAANNANNAGNEGFTNQNKEDKKEQLVKLKILEQEIGRRLQVFENMGDIKIDRYPIIASRVNKTIKNAMSIVGDYNELMNTIINNIRKIL